MNNVTINEQKCGFSANTKVQLTNGSLVLHYNKFGNCLGAYMVTSYRDQKGILEHRGEKTHGYCSLINLDDGYLKFEERCSRNSTLGRVIAHLVPDGDIGGTRAVAEGQYLEIYKAGDYKLNISFDKANNQVPKE